MMHLNVTCGNTQILSAYDLHVIKWQINVAFAIHPDFKRLHKWLLDLWTRNAHFFVLQLATQC